MEVPNTSLVYFGFPKCGSELMRKELNLKYDNKFSPKDWNACSLKYCHVKPSIHISKLGNINQIYFTIVRNTYERLVSSWNFLKHKAPHRVYDKLSFEQFIGLIYENKNSFHLMTLCWMFMPFEMYFDKVENNLTIFQLDDLHSVNEFLTSHGANPINTNKRINELSHDHYSTYYNDDLLKKVREVYAYEIEKFGYEFSKPMPA